MTQENHNEVEERASYFASQFDEARFERNVFFVIALVELLVIVTFITI